MKRRLWPLVTCLLSAAVIAAPASPVPAKPPVAMRSDADRQILQSYLKHTASAAKRVTPQSVAQVQEVEDIAWQWSRYVEMPLVAYQITGERKYLDQFVAMMNALLTRLRKGPDGYLGFRGRQIPLFQDKASPNAEDDVVITDFTVIHLICDFAEVVRVEPDLKAKYTGAVRRYLDIAENHLFKKWNARGQYVDLGKTGAVYRESGIVTESRKNLTHPHNKQSKVCQALLALYRVTGKDEYFRRAVKLGTRFKHALRLSKVDRYLWHYWDPAGPWDRKKEDPKQWKHWIGAEHRSTYHNLTVAMAVALYDHGVVFDKADIQRLVNTQMQVCWNGSSEKPVFRRTDGKPAEQPFLASDLARFEPRIWAYLYEGPGMQERLRNRDHPWQGGIVAQDYLKGKYLSLRSPKPQYAQYRARFVKKPENARFLAGLAFRVTPTAASARKP